MTLNKNDNKTDEKITFDTIKKKDKNYVMNNYNRFDLAIKKGSNSTCYDYENNKYIDFTSGIGVNSLGFCNENWQNAVINQVKTLNHTSNLYYTNPGAELAKMLCEKTGGKKVSFANSGAEANECAIKCARKYSFDKYSHAFGTNRHKIITLENSFHGRTITTLSATGQDVFHKFFNPFTEGFLFAKANNFQSVEDLTDETVCAIMIEAIQGEGGVVPLEKDFILKISKLCEEKDILLIFDEVQTGIGRTGSFFAYEQFGVKPDIVTSAKGLGGGLPIGATIFFEKCENVFSFGDHGTTFGANPICCAGAISVLNQLDDNFLNSILQKGEILK
ncbi:MAG: aminotransferase class III-fold pyridoxal phosphate-dependent enzyme [Clostridia bacterium]